MPEGDTIRHAQTLLKPVLEDRPLENVWFRKLRGHRPRPGQRVEAVEAVGKHLLVHFDRRLSLDVHLGMSGYWRVAESVPKPGPKLRIVLSTEAGHALCYAAPVIQTFLRSDSRSPVAHLGPDLSNDDVDIEELVRRSRRLADTTLLAELLLDQRVGAGVGNVFKSECLFIAGLHPFDPVASLSDDELRHLWGIAHGQLVANRDTTLRRTTASKDRARHHVYGRHRLGCGRCDNAIDYSPAGERTGRSTYWCPTCQPNRRS